MIKRSFHGDVTDFSYTKNDLTLENFNDFLQEANGEDVEITINSYGGMMYEGIAIYNALKDYNGSVTMVVNGIAGSAASLIALAGDKVVLGEGSEIFIHAPLYPFTSGNAQDLEDDAKELRRSTDRMVDIYANIFTKKTRDEIETLLYDQTFLTGAELKEFGVNVEVKGKTEGTVMNEFKKVVMAKMKTPSNLTIGDPRFEKKKVETEDEKDEVKTENLETTDDQTKTEDSKDETVIVDETESKKTEDDKSEGKDEVTTEVTEKTEEDNTEEQVETEVTEADKDDKSEETDETEETNIQSFIEEIKSIRARIDTIEADNAKLKEENSKKDEENKALKEENERLKEIEDTFTKTFSDLKITNNKQNEKGAESNKRGFIHLNLE